MLLCVCVCSNISQCAMFQLFSDFFLSLIFSLFFFKLDVSAPLFK